MLQSVILNMDEDQRTTSTPLNGANIIHLIRGIGENWKKLARQLRPRVPDSVINEIDSKFSNNDERIVKMIDYWIKDETITQPYPWRTLISALDWISETNAANYLMEVPKPYSYHKEPSFNVENVYKVYSLICPGNIKDSTDGPLFFAPARHDAIEKAHAKHEDRAYAYAFYAVNCHTQASWQFLATGLYHAAEIDALDCALNFLQVDKRGTQTQLIFTVKDISDILIQMAHHENWKIAFCEKDNLYRISLIGKKYLEKLESSHESIEEICHACAGYYISFYPGPNERFIEMSKDKGREATSLKALNPYHQSKELAVTAERLLNALKEVKSEDWNEIGQGLCIRLKDREKIRGTHDTADERKEALLKTYASDEYPHKTWWTVCSALRMCDYQELADEIKTMYIAPKFTLKDMESVVSLVSSHNRMSLIKASPESKKGTITEQDTANLSPQEYATLYMKHHPKTSWYYLIRDLYNMGETTAIKRLQNFIPTKPSDFKLDAKSVSEVLLQISKSLTNWKDLFGDHYRGVSLIPPSQLSETDLEVEETNGQFHVYAEYYVEYHPEASWVHLTAWIHRQDLMSTREICKKLTPVCKKLKQYLPPADPSLTVVSLTDALLYDKNTHKQDLHRIQHWDKLMGCLEIPNYVGDIIVTSSGDNSNLKRTSQLQYFVQDHPLGSWWLVYRGLQQVGHQKQAKYVKATYIDNDREFLAVNLQRLKKFALEYIRSITNIREKLPELGQQLLPECNQSWSNEENIVHEWLLRRKPSWRKLIYALDNMRETEAANGIIRNDHMEPVNEATMTVANLKAVLALLLSSSIKEYLSQYVPSSRIDVIERGCPDQEAQDHTIVCYYVKCSPDPTWDIHTCRLYIDEETDALDKLYTFYQRHQRDTTFTSENVLAVLLRLTPKDWKHIFSYREKKSRNGYQLPLVCQNRLDSIERTCKSVRECCHKSVEHYVTYHPQASWNHLAQIVYELAMEPLSDHSRESYTPDTTCLKQLIPFLPQKDSSLTTENVHEVVKDLDLTSNSLYKLFDACGLVTLYAHSFQKQAARESLIKNYVMWYPLRSWSNLKKGLQEIGQHELAENVGSKYIHVTDYSEEDIKPPMITKHPDIVRENKSLNLSVTAEGEGTCSYYWIKDGVAFFEKDVPNCIGSDTHTLCFTDFTEEHEGEYKCVVSNAGGSVESETVDLFDIDVEDYSEKECEEYTIAVESENEEYKCVAKSSHCALYLPKQYCEGTLHVENVKLLDLKPKAGEIVISPVVHVTSQGLTIRKNKPIIIELMKTIEYSEEEGTVVILFSSVAPVNYQDWMELDVKSELVESHIKFGVKQLGFFSAIARYQSQPLHACANLSPSVDDKSGSVELVIPGISEVQMQIPKMHVKTNTEVKATAHYEDTVYCMEYSNNCLATACVTFEPQTMEFAEPIDLSLVVPGYDEIKKKYPEAKLLLLSGAFNMKNGELEWEVNDPDDFTTSRHNADIMIATTQSKYLCPMKYIWRGIPSDELSLKQQYHKSVMNSLVTGFSGRCQVFMSGMTHVLPEHMVFKIAVLVYPYQAFKVYENLDQYEYSLMDSGKAPLEFKSSDLNGILKPKKCLFPDKELIPTVSLSGNFCSKMEFTVEVDDSMKLKGVLGNLFILSGDEKHTFRLRFPQNMESREKGISSAHADSMAPPMSMVLSDASQDVSHDQRVIMKMTFSEFCQDAHHRDGRVILNDAFKEYLTKYAESNKISLDHDDEIEERQIDEAFGKAKFEFKEATVHYDPKMKTIITSEEKFCSTPERYKNEGDKDKIYTHTLRSMKYEGLEYTESKSKTWSTTGGLSAKYKGIGASLSVGYTKNQSEQVKKSENVTQEQEIHFEVEVPKRSTRTVETKQKFNTHEVDVNDVILVFPSDAQIQCTVTNREPGSLCPLSWSKCLCKPTKKLDIREIFKFNKSVVKECDNKLFVRINGKCRWVETYICHETKEPQ